MTTVQKTRSPWDLVSDETIPNTPVRSMTHRLRVSGGFVYRTVVLVKIMDSISMSVSTTFKPGTEMDEKEQIDV